MDILEMTNADFYIIKDSVRALRSEVAIQVEQYKDGCNDIAIVYKNTGEDFGESALSDLTMDETEEVIEYLTKKHKLEVIWRHMY